MTKYPRTVLTCFLLILLILLHFGVSFGQSSTWRLNNRLQTGYEFDSNIRETSSDTLGEIGDSSLKFLFHSRALRTSPKMRLQFSYQGGLQTYFQNSIENKLINDVDAAALFRLQSFVFGLTGSGRLKIYLNDILDYSSGSLGLLLQLPGVLQLNNEIGLQTAGLTYQNFAPFDYSQNRLWWKISRKFGRNWLGLLDFAGSQVKYDRRALAFTPPDTTFRALDENQRDDNYALRMQLNYTRSFLLTFSYTFQRNTSNSAGYDYTRHQFQLIIGVPLPHAIWLRGFMAAQLKHYDTVALPDLPTDIDTERNESNFFVLDISKDLQPNLSGLLRFAYYNNESVLRSQFYSKFLITTGLDFRF